MASGDTISSAPDFNIDLSGITSGGQQKTLVWNGQKLVPITDLKNSYATLNKAQKTALVTLAGLMGKKSSAAKAIWNQLVEGASSQYQISGKQVSPWDIYNSTKANIPIGAGLESVPVVTHRITDYSNVANGYFLKAFNSVFKRMPTALDYASNQTDANGNPISWIDLFKTEASKEANQEVTTSVRNPDGTVREQTTKAAFDPEAWFTQNILSSYGSAIKSGQQQAPQDDLNKYTQLAAAYGVPVVDPSTKQLTIEGRMDLANIENGQLDWSNLQKNFSTLAAAKYQHLAPSLSAGLSLMQIAQPGIKIIAKKLGKDPNLMTVDDPNVQKYLSGDGKNVLNDYQTTAMIQQSKEWPLSQDAHDTFDNLSVNLMKRFGAIG